MGTVINCEGEVDVFAFATIMPLTLLQPTTFYQHIQNHFNKLVSNTHTNNAALQQFAKALDCSNQQLGLLLQGRFSNLPLPLIYQLHHNLFLDFEWTKAYKMGSAASQSNDVDEALIRQFKHIQQFLYIAPVTFEGSIASTQDVIGSSVLYFDCFEDECYFTQATQAYVMENSHDYFKGNKKFVCMLVPLKKFVTIVDAIKQLTNSN